MPKKFEIGKVYNAHFTNDYKTIIKVKIVGRTEKTVKYVILDHNKKEVKNTRTFINDGCECFYPLGRYSMAPIIRACRAYK